MLHRGSSQIGADHGGETSALSETTGQIAFANEVGIAQIRAVDPKVFIRCVGHHEAMRRYIGEIRAIEPAEASDQGSVEARAGQVSSAEIAAADNRIRQVGPLKPGFLQRDMNEDLALEALPGEILTRPILLVDAIGGIAQLRIDVSRKRILRLACLPGNAADRHRVGLSLS
jgi:hypothetical protein